MLPKIKLRTKLLFSFILLVTIALSIVNYLWFESSRKEIIQTTSSTLSSAASDVANQVQSYFDVKTIGLIVHSQTDAVLSGDVPKITEELQSYLNQDKYIEDLTLLDKSGKELVHITRSKIYPKAELVNRSNEPEFKIPTYVGGERYIGPLRFEKSIPHIYIALPVVQPDVAQEFRQLTTSSIGRSRQPGEIHGVLVATYNLQPLWEQIQTFKIGAHGYIFLVDDKGTVLAYPEQKFVLGQEQLTAVPEVAAFLATLTDSSNQPDESHVHESTNEFNLPVLIKNIIIPATNWGVIAQIPLSDTLAATNQAATFAIIVFLIMLTAMIILILGIAQQITGPIEKLQQGSTFIGSGKLDYRLSIHSGDEIEDLGNAFNSMASKLQAAFQTLQQDTKIITVERQKFETAVANIADAIIAVDLERRVIIFNKAAESLFGIQAAEAVGKSIGSIIKVIDNDKDAEINPAAYCPISYDPTLNVTWHHTNLKCISSIGKTVYVTASATQIPQGVQVNVGCLLAFHDLTAEKSLEEMKLDFVSMAAHELRTPLTALRGYLSVFMKENENTYNDQQKMFLQRISVSADRLTTLIENLLSVTKIERGVMTTQLEAVEWIPLVTQIIADLTNRAQDKKISLTFLTPSVTIPKMYADRVRIIEVLGNLIENAINYTPENGTVTVWIEANGTEVITHVKDSGVGIPPDAMPHLFTKFFRVTSRLTHGTKGTGLGLYIAKSIVDNHHGRIWVDSTVGKGSTFSFAIPSAFNQPIEQTPQ